MSNTRIVERIDQQIRDFKKGKISTTNLEQSVDSYVQALEKIDQKTIEKFRAFTYRVVSSDLTDDERELTPDVENLENVLAEFRIFLSRLKEEID